MVLCSLLRHIHILPHCAAISQHTVLGCACLLFASWFGSVSPTSLWPCYLRCLCLSLDTCRAHGLQPLEILDSGHSLLNSWDHCPPVLAGYRWRLLPQRQHHWITRHARLHLGAAGERKRRTEPQALTDGPRCWSSEQMEFRTQDLLLTQTWSKTMGLLSFLWTPGPLSGTEHWLDTGLIFGDQFLAYSLNRNHRTSYSYMTTWTGRDFWDHRTWACLQQPSGTEQDLMD